MKSGLGRTRVPASTFQDSWHRVTLAGQVAGIQEDGCTIGAAAAPAITHTPHSSIHRVDVETPTRREAGI